MDILPGILSGMPELQQALTYFLQQAQAYQGTQQTQLRDQAMRLLNQSGTLNSPSGQDILANALAKQSGEYSAQVAGQVVPWSLNLVGMANTIQEAQRQRAFQETQAGLDRQQQLAVLQRQIDEQLRYNRENIANQTAAFNASTDAYRGKYPDWNKDPMAAFMASMRGGGGGGGGGGLGGALGELPTETLYENMLANDAAAKERQSGFADWWNREGVGKTTSSVSNYDTPTFSTWWGDYSGQPGQTVDLWNTSYGP